MLLLASVGISFGGLTLHPPNSLPYPVLVQSANNPLGSGSTEFSGITYNQNTDRLLVVDNGANLIFEYDLDANDQIIPPPRRTISFPIGNGDLEGIAWLSGTTYAILSENDAAIYIVNMSDAVTYTTVAPGDVQQTINTGIPEISGAGNEGIGVDYNASTASNPVFWVVDEIPAELYRFDSSGLTHGPIALPGGLSDSSGVYVSPIDDTLYIASDVSAGIFQYEIDPAFTTATLLSSQSLPGFQQAEGITFSPDMQNLYVVGEQPNNSSLSYSHFQQPIGNSAAFTGLPAGGTNAIVVQAHSNFGVLPGSASYTSNALTGINTVTFNPARALYTGEEVKVTVTDPNGVGGACGFQWDFTAGPSTNITAGCFAGFREDTAASAVLDGVADSSVDWGDYDNDGDFDILLTGQSSAGLISKVYQNNNGTFTDIGAGLTGVENGSVEWGDYDNDGDLDILLTGSSSTGLISKVYQNNNGTFTDISAMLPGVQFSSVDWGDYDNDGDLDILLTGAGSISEVYQNDGNGTFTSIIAMLPPLSSTSVDWGDYNNDGNLDILLTGGVGGPPNWISEVYQNDGNGSFTNIMSSLPGVTRGSVDWGDYDNDGDLDILLTGFLSEVYRNDGNGNFTPINANLPGVWDSSVDWGDYDNDGDLDILLTGRDINSVRISEVYRNDGIGTFTNIAAGLPGVSNGSVDWGDYDNDGDLDILLTGVGFATIYENLGTLDLQLSKVANGPLIAGQTASYTLSVTNLGPETAFNTVLTDTLPPGLSAIGTNVFALGDLLPGASTSVTMNVIVDADPLAFVNCQAVNLASVSLASGDCNTSVVTSAVNVMHDLSLVVQGPASNVTATGTFVYTLVASNAGPSVAVNALVTNALPNIAGVSFAAGTLDPVTGLWIIGALLPGQSVSCTVTGTVSDCCLNTTLSIPASISAGAFCPNTSELVPANNNASASVQLLPDTTPPVLVGTPAATLSLGCGQALPPAPTVTATEDCGAAPVVSLSQNPATLGNLHGDTVTLIWTAQNLCGLSASFTQTITRTDTVPPTITCPAPVTVLFPAALPAPNANLAIASDDCGGSVSLSVAASQQVITACAETWHYVYTATDAAGNNASCTQFVTREFPSIPVISCPTGGIVNCTAATPAPGNASVSDPCDSAVVVTLQTNIGAGACVVEYVFSATNRFGNSASCTQRFDIVDATPPVLVGLPSATLSLGCGQVLPPAPNVTATEDCGTAPAVNFSQSPAVLGNLHGDTVTNIWTTQNACGLTATFSQTITRTDTVPPSITCPAAVTVVSPAALPTPNANLASATDACGGAVSLSVAASLQSTTVCAETWHYVYTATDAAGNNTNCTQVVVREFPSTPVLTCPAGGTIACTATPAPGNASVSDPCDAGMVVMVQTNIIAGACGAVEYVFSVTNRFGNTASCTQRFDIVDTTPPVLVGLPSATLSLSCGQALPPAPNVTATEDCGTAPFVNFSQSPAALGNLHGDTVTNIWSTQNACGLTATFTQTITRTDTAPPSITCPATVTVVSPAALPTPNANLASATDACGGAVSLSVAPSLQSTTACAETWHYVYTATDAAGNSTNCTQVVTRELPSTPVLTCPLGGTIACTAATPVPGNATVSDPCDAGMVVMVQTNIIGAGACGAVEYVFSVTNRFGNTASCTQSFDIVDTTPPVLVGLPAATLSLGCGQALPPTPNVTATEDCGTAPAVNFNQSSAALGNLHGDTVTRTWSTQNACGLTATFDQLITRVDSLPPTISCPASVTVVHPAPLPPLNSNNATASDDCGGPITLGVTGNQLSSNVCVEVWELVYTATDAGGNDASCTQMVVREFPSTPVITCPSSPTVTVYDCMADIPLPGVPAIADACDPSPGYLVSTQFAGTACAGSVTYTYTALNQVGNMASCSETFQHEDALPPTFSVPGPITIPVGSSTAEAATGSPSGLSDNCDPAPGLTVSNTPVPSGPGTFTRTWTATDACGNSASASQVITLSAIVRSVDLQLSGSSLPAVLTGPGLSLSLTVQNNGPDAASTIQLVSPLPPGASVASLGTNCALSGNIIMCSLSSLAAGDSAVFDIDLTMDGSSASAVTNLPVLSSDVTDANPVDNTLVLVSTQSDCEGDNIPDFADEDDDNDQIPDAWELLHGLDPCDAANAVLDLDGDGCNTLQEYFADTDPADAADVLRILLKEIPAGGHEIGWAAKSTRLYTVQRVVPLSDFIGGWVDVPGLVDLPGQNGLQTSIVEPFGGTLMHFRVRATVPQ